MAANGPRARGAWCCMCGVWKAEDNGLERCPVSHAEMQAMNHPGEGLSHLWAQGKFEHAMRIWDRTAVTRAEADHIVESSGSVG